MTGYIEIKEDQYEDTIEHLHRIKTLACLLILKLAEESEVYNRDYDSYQERRGQYNRNRYKY